MWRRRSRRTLDPGRPAVHPEQLALALVTAVLLLGGLGVLAWVLLA